MAVRRNLSIQDIAEAAGVSHTTVSRALRDSPLIRPEVRQRIQRIAHEMGYIPNAVAQSLRGERTNTIGLLVTTIADPFVGRVVRGIEETAQEKNLSLLLSVSNNDAEREMAVIDTFRRRRVDGLIITAARLTPQQEKRLVSAGLPTVLINPQAEPPPQQLPSVSIDDASGAQAAVRHLLGLGHRAIGYLGAANRPRSNQQRQRAYQEALIQAGIAPRPEWQWNAPPERRYHTDDVHDGQEMLPALIAAGVTAVFCCNDMMAIGALMACRNAGISVPDQLSLVGFDDVETAHFVSPPLTTVHQPRLRLGQMAMQMLLDLLEGRPARSATLPAELVERGSTAPPPAGGKKGEGQP